MEQLTDHAPIGQHRHFRSGLNIQTCQLTDRCSRHQRGDWVCRRILSQLVTGPDHFSTLNTGPGPEREVTPLPVIACCTSVEFRSAAKFPHGDHQGLLQEPALLQILDECGHQPVENRQEGAEAIPDPPVGRDVVTMRVPRAAGGMVAQVDRDEADAALDEATRVGTVIEAIDGARIAAGADWYPLLNRKAGKPVRLALLDPKGNTRWEETVKPIAWMAQSRLLYNRWWRSRREAVARLSNGRLGYAHIRGMNDGAYRDVFDEVFGRNVEKEALLLDTRFNGGGNLDEALTTFLSGRVFETNEPRGQFVGTEPSRRWTKPSLVIMSQGNYSDAHCFPMAYTQLGLGETADLRGFAKEWRAGQPR